LADTWNVNIDINGLIYEATKKLDYSLEYAEDRVKLVHNIINEVNKAGVLDEFLSSEGYRKKQVKNKNSFLAETEPLSKLLMRFSYYIDFPKYNNENDKKNKTIKKLPTLSGEKYKNAALKEGITDNFNKIRNNEILDIDFQNKAKKKDRNFRLAPKQEITDKDRQEYKELDEYCRFLLLLNNILGMEKGVDAQTRQKIHEQIAEKHGDNYLRMLKRIRKELKKELPLIKDKIRGTIYFKKIDKGHPEYCLDNDTGYVDEKGEYVLVSENKVELNNPKHIFALIENYADLKDGCWDKPESDLWVLLFELENLIEKTDLEPYEKDIIILKIDGLTGEEICKEINKKYNMTLSEDNLSRIYNTYIPKKIANTYDDLYEEWLYTFKVKGRYKKCNKCGENKLLNERHFYKEPKGKDGFKNTCIKCLVFEKNCKK
jgi:hypothetical protein